jgi:hypothetical protein
VSAREPQAPEAHDSDKDHETTPPPQPALSDSLHSAEVPLDLGASGRIQWRSFFRIALPLAAVAGFFTAYGYALGWLVLLPGSVVLAIYIYRRRSPGPLTIWQGTKIGAFIGILSSAFSAVLFIVKVRLDPAAFRQALDTAMQQAVSRNSDPQVQQQVQQMVQFFSGTTGIVIFTAMFIVFTLVVLLIIGGITGALTAFFSNKSRKSRP